MNIEVYTLYSNFLKGRHFLNKELTPCKIIFHKKSKFWPYIFYHWNPSVIEYLYKQFNGD